MAMHLVRIPKGQVTRRLPRGVGRKFSSRIRGPLVCSLFLLASCDQVFGVRNSAPEQIRDLIVTEIGSSSAQVEWTHVSGSDGYIVAYTASPPINWDAPPPEQVRVSGDTVGRPVRVTLENLSRGIAYTVQVVGYNVASDSAEELFSKPSNIVVVQVPLGDAEAVGDLEVASTTESVVSVRWTQVEDGSGAPARYIIAVSPTTVDWDSPGLIRVRVTGTEVGAPIVGAVTGLSASTQYEVQVATLPATATDDALTGILSNKITVQTTAPPLSNPFFSDNFDTGARVNANGFSWGNSTGLVVSSEAAFSGTHSLRFRYGPDSAGEDSHAEQRFSLGRNVTEVWLDYMLLLPSNYIHRTDNPSNNKFFRIWGDSYSAQNKVGASTLASGGGANSSFRFEFVGSWTTAIGLGGSNNPSTIIGAEKSMLGRWTRVRLHFRHVSAAGAKDGLFEVWFDGEKLSFPNVDQNFDVARPYWNTGYLLGWANSGFTEETRVYIDDVKFYSTNPGW